MGHSLADRPLGPLEPFRLAVYQLLSHSGHRETRLDELAVVRVTDEEFWKGELAGRRPTNRTYLGRLLSAVCEADPVVVALDLDLSSPFPDGEPLTHQAYVQETENLAAAVSNAHCRVVLPVTLSCPHPPNGECKRRPNALDAYQFDPKLISYGYINVPTDPRQIPLSRANVTGGSLGSFAQALVAVKNNTPQNPLHGGVYRFPYGSFVPESTFEHAHRVVSASEILEPHNANALATLHHKAVLIGAAWHVNRYHDSGGPIVDSHSSPAGSIAGVFLHANYAAAILDHTAVESVGEPVSLTLEAFVVAVIAIVFALDMSWLKRWLYIIAVTLLLGLISYVFWQNLGIFLEVTAPALLLLLHAVVEEYRACPFFSPESDRPLRFMS